MWWKLPFLIVRPLNFAKGASNVPSQRKKWFVARMVNFMPMIVKCTVKIAGNYKIEITVIIVSIIVLKLRGTKKLKKHFYF